jgi:protein disulfide-isomerase-like protein
MDYYNKILILKKYLKQHIDNGEYENVNKTLLNIKSLHGKVIELILNLKDSSRDNKLEVLSDLERINFKIISIIEECENLTNHNTSEIESNNKSTNESKKINKNLPSLILFYAEWCGHCKNFMPTWDALSDLLPSDKINIVKISCVEKEKQCNSIKEIKGYPTIIYVDINTKKLKVYSGEREPKSIINFINNCSDKKIIELTE